MTEPVHTDALVVGAGISGLVAAHTLRGRGLSVIVLEAGTRSGGQVLGVELDGLPGVKVDVGAESFASRGTAVGELAGELDLTVVAPAALSAWVFADGHTFPLPKAGVLGIPGNPFAPDVRRAIGWAGALRASRDRFWPTKWTDTSTMESFVRSRMGRRVADRLVATVATGVYSAPLDRLDINAVSPGLLPAFEREGSLAQAVLALRAQAPAGSAVFGIDGGIHQLAERLDAQITANTGATTTARPGALGQILCQHEVTGIERDGDTWAVTVDTAAEDGVTFTAPRLVVTTPTVAELMAPLVGRRTDNIPEPEPGADIHLVTALLRAPELDDAPRGTGMLVAPQRRDVGREPHAQLVRAKAMTHSTAKWPWLGDRVRQELGPGHHVVRLSYGRVGSKSAPDTDVVIKDLTQLFGVELNGRMLANTTTRWNGALPPPTPSYRKSVAGFVARVDAVDGLGVTGGWISGTGLATIVGHARDTAAAV